MRSTLKKTKFIFVPTFKCNLNCSYCDYRWREEEDKSITVDCFEQTWNFAKELRWLEWIAMLARFRPYFLELTGGEPLMYRDLPELLAHLPCGNPQNKSWAITSNTLNTDVLKAIEPDNCKFWTASYHYHSRTQFLDNIEWLKLRGFPVRVTLVLTPDNLDKVVSVIDEFRRISIMTNVHILCKKDFSWEDSQEKREVLKAAEALHDGVWINVVSGIARTWAERRFSSCEAGRDFFALRPNGYLLRCWSDIVSKRVLGHVLTYKIPPEGLRPCDQACLFPCDLEPIKGVEYHEKQKSMAV